MIWPRPHHPPRARRHGFLGVGAAWFEQERGGYGTASASRRAGERLARLEEALQICLARPPEVVRQELEVGGVLVAVGRDPAETTATRLRWFALGGTGGTAKRSSPASPTASSTPPGPGRRTWPPGPGSLLPTVERYRKAGVHVFVSDMAHTSDGDRIRLAGSCSNPWWSAARPREGGPPLGRPLPPH